jgi:thymidylate synthase ThyX
MMEQRVDLLYFTEQYPKLVEMVARQCYQSFDKVSETSHSFIRSIMSKGHLSVASVGNIVFGVKKVDEQVYLDLLKMKEVNNFVRWTISPIEASHGYAIIISMNMLTFLDIKNSVDGGNEIPFFGELLELTNETPTLAWFYDRNVDIEPKVNEYIQKPTPALCAPVMMSEDHTALKNAGFTDHELLIHATVTINYMTDRATGLQFWRHGDMTGGTELSQRYVNRGSAQFREMIGFESEPELNDELKNFRIKLKSLYEESNENYNVLLEEMGDLGVHAARAKEVARSILPNAIVTQIIQCRPLRQWEHFFHLRDSNHAQKEAQADARSLKQLFEEYGIFVSSESEK